MKSFYNVTINNPRTYLWGKCDRKGGISIEDNPYDEGTPDHKDWRNGWMFGGSNWCNGWMFGGSDE